MNLKEFIMIGLMIGPATLFAQSVIEKEEKGRLKVALSYVSGPEVYHLKWPPLKVSVDYFFDRQRDFYVGMDGSLNIWGFPSRHTGFQVGFQDHRLNSYVECGLDVYWEDGSQITWNPRIGHDFPVAKGRGNFFVEVGPSFYLHRDLRLPERNYIRIDPLPINLEFGLNSRF